MTVTFKSGDGAPFPQELVPKTLIIPDTAESVKSTIIVLVLLPLTMITPAGKVQVYPVAFVMEGTE